MVAADWSIFKDISGGEGSLPISERAGFSFHSPEKSAPDCAWTAVAAVKQIQKMTALVRDMFSG